MNSDSKNGETSENADRSRDDVDEKKEMQTSASDEPKLAERRDVMPLKRRKRRRGKSKRKHPYVKNRIPNVVIPEAPYNTNQFLLEDHCDFDNLDEKLLKNDKASASTSSTINRTRDSSFSVDSEGEFYSSPDDEEQFLIKDFDYQYETLHAEHLNNLSKADLIQEYLSLEQKVELLSNILRKRTEGEYDKTKIDLQMEIERLKNENDALKEQNYELRSKLSTKSQSSSSSDSSSDSDSDSSTSSSSSNSCDINGTESLNSSNTLNNCKRIDLSS